MNEHLHYASYKDYLAKYDETTRTITILNEANNAKAVLQLDGMYLGDERVYGYEDYVSCNVRVSQTNTYHQMIIHFVTDTDHMPECDILLRVDSWGVKMVIYEIGHYVFHAQGTIEY